MLALSSVGFVYISPSDQFWGMSKHLGKKQKIILRMLKTNICISKLGFTRAGNATDFECDVMGQFEAT